MKQNHLKLTKKKLAEAQKLYNTDTDVRRVLQILREARGYILDTIDFFAIEAQKLNSLNLILKRSLLMENSLSKREQQTLFQAVLNKFLSKNAFFQGTTIVGIGVFILITLLLSLISYWIPLIAGGYFIFKGLRKSIPGVKKDLTDLEKRTIILLESDD